MANEAKQVEIDFNVNGGGTIYLLQPLTAAAREWVDENIGSKNGYQPYWPTVVVEHRYIQDIVEGIRNDGLTVA